jgi:hypothetical protein
MKGNLMSTSKKRILPVWANWTDLKKWASGVWDNRRKPLEMGIILLSMVGVSWLISFFMNPLVITSVALMVFAFYTAESNWENARINLFNRRMKLYNDIHNALDGLALHSEEYRTKESLEAFYGEKQRETEFLFDDNIVEFVNEARRNALSLFILTKNNNSIRSDLETMDQNSEEAQSLINKLTSNIEKSEEKTNNIFNLRKDMHNLFKKYLSFNHIK